MREYLSRDEHRVRSIASRSAHLPKLFRAPTMSGSVDSDELSISYHLRAVKRKLRGVTSGGRYVWGLQADNS